MNLAEAVKPFLSNTNIFFGASSGGKIVKESFLENKLTVDFFCDNDPKKIGTNIDNILVLSPDEACRMYRENDANIIITSSYIDEIYHQLIRALDDNSRLFTFPFTMDGINYFDFIKSGKLKEFEYKLDRVRNNLSDKRSMEFFNNIRLGKLTLMARYYVDSYSPNPYLIEELSDKLSNSIIVDCGAFDGDTVRQFIDFGINFKKYFCFEIGAENYEKLLKYVETANLHDKVIPVFKGVWHKDTKLYTTGISGSNVSLTLDKSGNAVDLVALDNFFKDEKIDFIKMDIEGAEMNALKGSIKLIKSNRCMLAVCIYHTISDFADIPFYLINELDDYNFYISHHALNTSDTVFYCIPKERFT